MVLFYHLMALIDMVVYSIASSLFRIIMDLANAPLFRVERISEIASRIYIVVGVLMLFKLVISGIQYIINPDVFDDKEKGLGGLLKRTALSLAMMVAAPIVFNFLIALQTPIITTLPTIILGGDAPVSEEMQQKELDERGFKISFDVLRSFVRVRDGHEGTKDVKEQGKVAGACTDESCQIHDFQSFYDHITNNCPWSVLLGSMDSCTYDYMIVVSSICGGFMVYVLLSMTLDVAIRTIKFGIIQILAPIPISSYVFSKDKLNKFIKTAGTVYADLFIRMAIIYFIIFAIQEILRTDVLNFFGINGGGIAQTGDWFRNMIVNVVLIFGLLMFASKAPKFISELLGLPDIGAGDMADMFKPAWQRAGGAAGALINPLTNAATNFRQTWGVNKNDPNMKKSEKLRRALTRAAGGFGKGMLDSAQGVMAGDDWSKMRQRHEQATSKSLNRALTAATARKNRAEGQSRLESIKKQIQDLREKNRLLDSEETLREANARYAKEQQRLQQLGETIKSGKLTGDDLSKAMKEYTDLSAALSNKDAWIENAKYDVVADTVMKNKVSEHNAKIKANEQRIAEIDAKLASDGASMSTEEYMALQSEKYNKEQENLTEQAEIEKITHENEIKQLQSETKDKIKTNRSRIAEITSILNGSAEDDILKSCSERLEKLDKDSDPGIASMDRALSDIDLKLASETDPQAIADLEEQRNTLLQKRSVELEKVEQRRALEKEKVQKEYDDRLKALQDERAESEKVVVESQKEYATKLAGIRASREQAKTKIIDEYKANNDYITNFESQYRMLESSQQMTEHELSNFGGVIPRQFIHKLDSYFGGNPVTGKGYTDFSNLLGQTRSSIYTGEAMTKMRQNADILVEEDGVTPLKFSSKFITGGNKFTYEQMASFKQRLANNDLKESELKNMGFQSAAVFQSAFEDIEKKAAAAYYTANIAMINGDVTYGAEFNDDGTVSKPGRRIKLKRPDLNSAIVESFESLRDSMIKAGVPEEQRKRLLNEFLADPGSFMARASTQKDLYATTGKKIIDAQQPDSGGKK